MNFGEMSEHKPVAFYGGLDTVKFVGDNENMNFSSTAIREVCYGLQNNRLTFKHKYGSTPIAKDTK
jgi:hypothetical protein